MVKRTYNISGFDCPNCALKSANHLCKHPKVSEAVIDFPNDKLHISFDDEELTIEEIKAVIKEVETDEIVITNVNEKKEHHSFFNFEVIFTLARIFIGVVVMVVTMTALHESRFFWLNFGLYLGAIILLSYDIYIKVIKNIIHKVNPIDMHLLMTLSSVGPFIMGSLTHDVHMYMEGLMVVTLYQVGEIFEHYATYKSKEKINKAINLRVDRAFKLIENKFVEVDPKDVKVNDIVLIPNGNNIPVDGIVVEGEGEVDVSSLTGEFVPVIAQEGIEVFSGCLVKSGSIKIKATKEYSNSTASRLLDLISNSGEKKAKADEFVSKFARVYTPSIFGAAIITAVIGGAITTDWMTYIMLGLKMIVVGCPCAIVISVPLAYFASIGLASKHGIVVKGTNYLDRLYELKKVVTDKTGTLTKGVFEIKKVEGISADAFEYLYAAESLSKHPIAKAIISRQKYEIKANLLEDYEELPGLGVSAVYKDKIVLAGNYKLLDEYQVEYKAANENGVVVYLAIDNEFIGYVVLDDEVKTESQQMVRLFNKEKIETVLLTGDKESNAKAICESLGISKYRANLLPSDKVTCLESEMLKKGAVAFIGDGLNDAASIRQADIGFAMGAIGSDAAVENADIVIMNDNPLKVYDAYKISKIARHVAVFNIVFALFVKFSIEIASIVSSAIGYPDVVPLWLAVAADTGLTVVLIINSLLILYRKIGHKGI